MLIKIGDVAKLENFDNPAQNAHYKISRFIVSQEHDLKVEWENLETKELVAFPLDDFEEHVKYLIPCTPIRYVKIQP